jgi:hypothetical protein
MFEVPPVFSCVLLLLFFDTSVANLRPLRATEALDETPT